MTSVHNNSFIESESSFGVFEAARARFPLHKHFIAIVRLFFTFYIKVLINYTSQVFGKPR